MKFLKYAVVAIGLLFITGTTHAEGRLQELKAVEEYPRSKSLR